MIGSIVTGYIACGLFVALASDALLRKAKRIRASNTAMVLMVIVWPFFLVYVLYQTLRKVFGETRP